MKYPQLVSMPSAVSDWLEEQLEARGLDAVYSHYIISLLHSDSDVVCSDEDLRFTCLNKEVRQSGGGRKRFRGSSHWRKNTSVDVDKLKRNAAVECLMSASDQSCEFESLIDELCKKLDSIQSDTTVVADQQNVIDMTNRKPAIDVSPQELAKRYYAAFPALKHETSPGKLLAPKWVKKANQKTATKLMNDKGEKCQKKTNDKIMANWDFDDAINMYDLPFDIKELLDDSQKAPEKRTTEIYNMANMTNYAAPPKFIPYGTNTSIWSNDTVDIYNIDSFVAKAASREETMPLFDDTLQISLSVLMHDSDKSPFVTVHPNKRRVVSNFNATVGSNDLALKKNVDNNDDLLTSVNSHFRPINEKKDGHVPTTTTQHADGTTFSVSNNWNRVDYVRSRNGSIFMSTDPNRRHRYGEVKKDDGSELVVKFLICQNDKACQTDNDFSIVTGRDLIHDDNEALNDFMTEYLDSGCVKQNNGLEMLWKKDPRCNCQNTVIWSNAVLDHFAQDEWDDRDLFNIWKSDDVCNSCRGQLAPTVQQNKLRDDVRQDGDQLLSDLSVMQKSYMNESSVSFPSFIERKRRHSLISTTTNNNNNNSEPETAPWSFASRLEEDCLVQMAALPTLRSVTL